ncbi:cation:proton antiporter [Streptomyces scopuliridis]|uniref:cation:proton antiporter domain-containing protein n=1 Tax=Streptomyces scopuliridis TaxID=452529 RepID=UPI0036B3E04B
MDQLALLLVLLLGAVVMVPLGERLGLPSPVLMTLVGIALALLPFVPNVQVPPDFILPLLLPPLLYAAVQRTSWRQFAANVRPILLLAVALVFVTTAAVAAVANSIVPGLPIAAAVALGALVAPPDPVAATAVAGDTNAERELEHSLAIRAAKAAKRRLREIEEVEDLPEEISERLQRGAGDIGVRISPDLIDDERREWVTKRVERIKIVQRIQREMMSAARHEVLSARNEPGSDPEIVDRVLRHLDVRSMR